MRWGDEELDPRRFSSLLSTDYINRYFTKYAKIAGSHRTYWPETLEGLKLGEDYQV